MDRSNYVALRSSVSNLLAGSCCRSCGLNSDSLTNEVMRLFLSALVAQEVKAQNAKRAWLTFRRRSDVTVPGWAFHKPGFSSRFPIR